MKGGRALVEWHYAKEGTGSGSNKSQKVGPMVETQQWPQGVWNFLNYLFFMRKDGNADISSQPARGV